MAIVKFSYKSATKAEKHLEDLKKQILKCINIVNCDIIVLTYFKEYVSVYVKHYDIGIRYKTYLIKWKDLN